jgi:hypothetical protein
MEEVTQPINSLSAKRHPLSIAAVVFLMAFSTSILGIIIAEILIPVPTYAIGVGLEPDNSGGPMSPDCFTIGCGVGGTFAPGLLPPLGDGDIITFALSCGPTVTIIGPKGNNWGTYQWAMSYIEPPQGPPYDYWQTSYVTNAYPYTHAGEDMVGYAIPTLNPLCPLPMLIEAGTTQFKSLP